MVYFLPLLLFLPESMLHSIIARQGIIYDIKVLSFKTLKVQVVICYEL